MLLRPITATVLVCCVLCVYATKSPFKWVRLRYARTPSVTQQAVERDHSLPLLDRRLVEQHDAGRSRLNEEERALSGAESEPRPHLNDELDNDNDSDDNGNGDEDDDDDDDDDSDDNSNTDHSHGQLIDLDVVPFNDKDGELNAALGFNELPKQSDDVNIRGALELAQKADKSSKSIVCWLHTSACEDIVRAPMQTGKRLDLKRAYKHINERLATMLNTDNVHNNMHAIQAWLQRELGRGVRPETRTLVEALENLSELTHLSNELDRCTATMRSTISSNDRWLGADSIKRLHYGEMPKTRLGKIIYHYAQDHSKECQKHYWKQFQEHKETIIGRPTFEPVRAFLGDILSERVRRMAEKHQLNIPAEQQRLVLQDGRDIVPWIHEHSKQLSKFVSKMRPLYGHDDAVIGLKWLRSMAHLRKDSRIRCLRRTDDEEVDKLRLVEVFLDYLVEPCEEYRRSIRDMFGQVDFDIIRVQVSNFDPPASSGAFAGSLGSFVGSVSGKPKSGLKFIKSSLSERLKRTSHKSTSSASSKTTTTTSTTSRQSKPSVISATDDADDGVEFFQVLMYYDACEKLLIKKEHFVEDITRLVNKKL